MLAAGKAAQGSARGRMWLLAMILFFAIFLNGFEAGGYQACLQSIGDEYSLNTALMGAFASVQLVAGLIAPLVFGPLADKRGKRGMLLAFLAVQVLACLLIVLTHEPTLFVAGIFMVGISVSTVQFVALAALTDAYPQSGTKKLGYITGMYSLGAVASPLVCGWLLAQGQSWRTLFIILACGTAAVCAGLFSSDFSPREERPANTGGGVHPSGEWYGAGIAALCLVMFVYVGVESGIAYFMNSFVGVELGGSSSYLALSLFWLAMVPSRLLCGNQSRHKDIILVGACAGAGIFAAAFGLLGSADLSAVLAFVLGFFCGAVYPSVLGYCADYAGERTATATGLITAATGLGGAIVTAGFGWMAAALGMRAAFEILGALMMVDVAIAIVLLVTARRAAPGRQAHLG